MTEMLSCETCAYYKDQSRSWTDNPPTISGTPVRAPKTYTSAWIECRRKPPTVVPNGREQRSMWMWPVVEADDWCGEWDVKFGGEPK